MTLRFRGNETQGIDGKGRVSIPADFRPVIAAGDTENPQSERPSFYIVYGDEDWTYFACYTHEGIAAVEERIAQLPDGAPEREYLETVFQGFTQKMQLGEDGRIVLPAKLRAKLGIDDKIFFIAANDHFKMWKPETYEDVAAQRLRNWREAQGPGFNPLSLLPPRPAPR